MWHALGMEAIEICWCCFPQPVCVVLLQQSRASGAQFYFFSILVNDFCFVFALLVSLKRLFPDDSKRHEGTIDHCVKSRPEKNFRL